MSRREQIIYNAMSDNITRAAALGLCPGPFVVMRSEYRRVVRREHKHYGMGVCLKIYSDGNVHAAAWQKRKPDDFCSYGERKDCGDADR